MVMIVLDRREQNDIIRDRRERGIDRYDEVWDGVYFMSPIADIEHQGFVFGLVSAIGSALNHLTNVGIFPGCNVSDREEKWEKNYRVPDVAVFLPGNPARNEGSHFFGGPDFAVEILSRQDRARKKLMFYAKVGVRELLLINRRPWALELYRLADGELRLVGKVGPDATEGGLSGAVLPVSFRLLPADPRPTIEVTHTADARRWLI